MDLWYNWQCRFGYIIAGSSNGRTSVFGAEYLGSSPSPATSTSLSINSYELFCV